MTAGTGKPGGPTRRGQNPSAPRTSPVRRPEKRVPNMPDNIPAPLADDSANPPKRGAVRCYWLEPTDRMWRGLRCYVGSSKCRRSGMGYHDVTVPSREVPLRGYDDEGYHSAPPARRTPKDPPWPYVCACGHDMEHDDDLRRQVVEARLFEAPSGARYTLSYRLPTDAPDGAMWDATWLHEVRTGDDGISLTVRCPVRQDWHVDLQSSSGGFWTRTGDPRTGDVTAAPSISIGLPDKPGHYHGFLTGGWLIPC